MIKPAQTFGRAPDLGDSLATKKPSRSKTPKVTNVSPNDEQAPRVLKGGIALFCSQTPNLSTQLSRSYKNQLILTKTEMEELLWALWMCSSCSKELNGVRGRRDINTQAPKIDRYVTFMRRFRNSNMAQNF